MENCVFCRIIKGEIEADKVYEDDKFFAFMDMKPVNSGHVLVIPKQHIDYIFDIKEPLYSEMFKTAKKLAGPIKNAVQSRRIGIAVEGFGVPHAHIHLVPINRGYELDPNRAKPADAKELKIIAEKIKKELEK